jgi:diphthine-ammonia ligase
MLKGTHEMKVVVNWSGGKECALAYQKVVKQGHQVAHLLTFEYMKPYIFHSFKVMELQAKTLGTPLLRVKIKKPYEDILKTFTRLHNEEGVEAVVTGDIVGAGCAIVHSSYYESMCKEAGMTFLMPNENPSSDTYDVLKEEVVQYGLRPILNCINTDFFGEEWLGKRIDEKSIIDLKALADEKGIDVCSEDGQGYHSEVVDAPFYKESIKIDKFKTGKYKEKSKNWKRNWLYMDIKECSLQPKKQ